MWESLSEPWRASIDQAWESYCAGSLPIGAVLTDSEGRILAAGRSRREENSGPPGAIFGHKLAHAEINALLALDLRRHDPRRCVLYTTTEPCPLCAGALRMSNVGRFHYASREPWAGSAGMFETVPYLKNAKVRVVGPEDQRLEAVLVALQVERFLHLKPEVLDRFMQLYEAVMPVATLAGRRLYASGILQAMSREQIPASDVLLAVNEEIGPTA